MASETTTGTVPFVVAVEGIDRAGKTTQTALLRAALEADGDTVTVLSFPRYDSFFGRTIRQLLDGHGATSAATLDPRSMSLWYALDRWQAFRHLDPSASVVLLNRYTLSNAVYQSSRAAAGEADELFDWVLELEHGQLGLPEPDLTVVLDIDPALSRHRSHGAPPLDDRGDRPDVYERSDALLAAARQRYLHAAATRAGVVVVGGRREQRPVGDGDGTDPGSVPAGTEASPERIHLEVLAAVRARRPSRPA